MTSILFLKEVIYCKTFSHIDLRNQKQLLSFFFIFEI